MRAIKTILIIITCHLKLPNIAKLLHIFYDISNIQDTGKVVNNTYLHSQPSQPHALSLQDDVIMSKWR